MNYKLNTSGGDTFFVTTQKAKRIAEKGDVIVEFEFNGVICLLDKNTNVDWLFRDYSNSWTMGWKAVGPNCLRKYGPDVQSELNRRTMDNDKKRAKAEAEYMKKEAEEKKQFESKVRGIELELSDVDGWNKSRKANPNGEIMPRMIYFLGEGQAYWSNPTKINFNRWLKKTTLYNLK